MTTTPVTESILHKVRSLVAKANATEFPAEAEAFFAKAQELITRYSIDAALLRDADPASAHRPVNRVIVVHGVYATARGALLNQVAEASGVRCIGLRKTLEGSYQYGLIGFEGDVELVELLFTELDLHLAREISKTSAADLRRRESLRGYRTSFAYGFATRIGERLLEAKRAAEAAAKAEETVVRSVALAIVSKDLAVKNAFKAFYPQVREVTRKVSAGSGYYAGIGAANKVNLNRNKAVR